MTAAWTLVERASALRRAERDGVDLLVIGGGITGAGVLRDAASRGLRALLVERDDFASGTSSRSSKMVHGGLRYIGEGHLGVTRESCRERDRLVAQSPNLVESVPFLFPAFDGGRHPLWQIHAALFVYRALASFRPSARFRMLRPDEVPRWSRDLRSEGLHGAGLYHDAQVDDARLVLETLRSARALGAEAVSHAEVVELERDVGGRLAAARVHDRLERRTMAIRAHAFVNAAGPAVERVRGLDRPVTRPELRPAKGVHLVIPRSRVHLEAAITFPARDGRPLFLAPWQDVAILGTTDTFTDEIDEPGVTIEEVHYLLAAANEAFPRVGLTTNDLRSVYAGVRPLVASPGSDTPATSVSREHRIYRDPSGLVSAAGGKLTTHRSTGEEIVDLVLGQLPARVRETAGPSRTAKLPLREDGFDRAAFEAELARRSALPPHAVAHLVRHHGASAESLLAEAPPGSLETIGRSRFCYAEIPWVVRTECPASLCDLLERRMRLAIFAEGQGLPELDRIVRVAADAAGWDEGRARSEAAAYARAVRRRYQIVLPEAQRTAPARVAAA
ncbi:MAG TPA: glycerol-3-phosphate dehydrogenase/oxidase [Myxococcota bacterium]|nr:glycerol-3-phosphate dehydrogenase/oxidase [Myxococcota bacterium]